MNWLRAYLLRLLDEEYELKMAELALLRERAKKPPVSPYIDTWTGAELRYDREYDV